MKGRISISEYTIERAKRILRPIQGGAEDYKTIDHGGRWSHENYDEYYKFFNHPDVEHRKYSILIFLSALAHWELSRPFYMSPLKLRKKEKILIQREHKFLRIM